MMFLQPVVLAFFRGRLGAVVYLPWNDSYLVGLPAGGGGGTAVRDASSHVKSAVSLCRLTISLLCDNFTNSLMSGWGSRLKEHER